MKKVLLSLVAGLVSFAGYSQLSGTYTIDPNGSGPTNFTTWNAAVTALETNGVSGAVTFNVSDDTFNESVQLDAIPGSSTTNTVTFQADPSNTGEAVLANNSFYGHVLRIDGTTNVTFSGLTIEATNYYCRPVYLASTNTNILFENNNIHAYAYSTTSNYNASIYGSFTTSNNVVFDGNDIANGQIYLYYSDDVVFTGNNIHDTYYYGAYLYNCDDTYWEDNFISAGDGSTSYYGYCMYIYYGSGHTILSNEIAGNGYGYNYGIRLYYHYGTSGNPTRIENNFIYNLSNNSYYSYGIYTYYTGNIDVKHNTISSEGAGYGGYNMYMANYSYSYGGNTVMNNILHNPYDGNGYGYNAYFYAYNATSTYFDTLDGNVYDYHGGEFYSYVYGSGQQTSLSGWQTATGNQEANSVNTSVPFMGGGDYHINPSMAALAIDNAGVPTNVYDDIDGETRYAFSANPDPGADEFVVPTNNAAVSDLIKPDAPLCSDDTTVIAVLANTGLVPLTSCTLTYALNGSVVTTMAFSGNVPVGGDTSLTIVSSTSFSNGDEVKVWSSMPNGVVDSNAANDTASVEMMAGLTGTFNIPNDYPTLTDAAADVMDKGICGHVVMEVSPGSYNEQIILGEFVGAGENATLTWRSTTGNAGDVDINYNTSAAVVDLNGADWVTFENLTLRNSTTFYGYTVLLQNGAEHNTFDHNIIKAGEYYTTSSSLSPFRSTGLNNDLTVTNNEILGGGYGLYIQGTGSSSRIENVVVENNLLNRATYRSAHLYYIDGFEFNNNEVTNDSVQSNFYYGVYMFYVDDFNVTGNYIGSEASYPYSTLYGGYAYPLYMYYCVGSNNPRSEVSNNCVTAGKSGSNYYGYYGIYSYYSGLYNFHNNSVAKVGGYSGYYGGMFRLGGLVSVKNNSFLNYVDGLAFYADGFTVSEEDNNNFFTTGSQLIYYGTTQYATLEDYQTASGFGANSIVTDPAYIDTLGCVTCNDTLDNAGTPTQMYDIDSNMRSVNTPDIGPKEWVSPANFTLGGDSTYCADEVTIEAGPAQSVTWSVNGNSSTAPTLTLSGGNEAVTYNVLVSIQTEFCGSAADNALITLVPNAHLDSNIHICADDNATLDPGGLASGSYAWSTGAMTQTILVDEPGTYTVTKDVQGCVSTATTEVTQSEAVQIIGTEVCSDDLPLTLDATIANGTTYAWSGGASPNTATNTFNDGGAYTVTASDAFGCSSVDSFEVVVLEEPEAVITTPSYSGFIYVFDASTSPYLTASSTVNWNFGAGASPATSTNVSESVIYPWSNPSNPTTYSVSLEINNGCGVDIATQIIQPSLGIENLATGEFAIFPNPANDVVTIATKDVEAGNIQILDMSGRVVAQAPMSAGSNNHDINVSSLAAGAYIVKVATDANTQMQQLIVQ